MSLTRDEVIAWLERQTASELDELIRELQTRLRLDPVQPTPQWTMGAAPTMGMPEQTDYEVRLDAFGADKIAVIKAVRELWPLGLMEAKKLVESAPVLLRDGLTRGEAEDIAGPLRRAGAEITIR